MSAPKRPPALSVVVAALNARSTIEECLGALQAQLPAEGVEVVVVDGSSDSTSEVVRIRFPDLGLLEATPRLRVPELWERGIRATSGSVVALTTAHCVPAKDWLATVMAAHAGPAVGVGGAVEPDAVGSLTDWAVYFCRYSPYMLPLVPGPAADLAGDNASYKRAAIDGLERWRRYGFWESPIHDELRRRGLSLRLDPAIVVTCRRAFSLGGFVRQRLAHGMAFGRERAREMARGHRLLYAAAAPVIPVLLAARIVRRVVARRRHRRHLVACLPLLGLFLLAWALGEALGYLRGAER